MPFILAMSSAEAVPAATMRAPTRAQANEWSPSGYTAPWLRYECTHCLIVVSGVRRNRAGAGCAGGRGGISKSTDANSLPRSPIVVFPRLILIDATPLAIGTADDP